jgi:hypothetical protein
MNQSLAVLAALMFSSTGASAQVSLLQAQNEIWALLKAVPAQHASAGRPSHIPQMSEGTPDEGPEAALAFLRASRGDIVDPSSQRMPYTDSGKGMKYPESFPVPIAGLRNIVAMTPQIWTPEQLMIDFEKNKTPEQIGFIVFLKTEYCSQNAFRGCAVTTAAFEKRTTPLLKRFRVYGAWVEHLNPDREIPGHDEWLDEVRNFYDFDQGPGANIYIFIPGKPLASSDAYQLGMSETEFETNGGRALKLESWLQSLIP